MVLSHNSSLMYYLRLHNTWLCISLVSLPFSFIIKLLSVTKVSLLYSMSYESSGVQVSIRVRKLISREVKASESIKWHVHGQSIWENNRKDTPYTFGKTMIERLTRLYKCLWHIYSQMKYFHWQCLNTDLFIKICFQFLNYNLSSFHI